ncbi:hypothetical protein ABZP36_017452 [Zizania latifolia]
MVAQLLAIERQISEGREHTKEAASAFSAVILSARSLAHPTISHREKLNELKNRLRKLEHDLAEALSIQVSKGTKYELTGESISNANISSSEYLMAAIEAFEANSDATEKKSIEEAIMWYKKFLGFQVVGGEGYSFVLFAYQEGYFVGLDLVVLMLRIEALLYYPISTRPRWKIYAGENVMQETGLIDAEINYYTYNERKNRNKNGGAMRDRGWKYGSGFVDGVFPVLSPMAQDILEFVPD